jgi:hypothetical protein
MSQAPLTPKDIQAREKARLEFRDAANRFEKAVQEGKPTAEIDEALRALIEKQTTYRSFGS